MGRRIALSVSQLNEYVRRLFQQDPLLCEVELKGEISNLKYHQTGTLFFTLKDELSSISCVMYAQDAYALQVEPFDGMRSVIIGSVGLYTRGGQYQFYVKEIKTQGLGVLYERYQLLKERLEREGLFSDEKKRSIPEYIDTLGVVTSPTGAVIHDIMSVAFRRDCEASILLCPVRVQGGEAADEVVAAIHLLEQLDHVSVIVLARGGGSIEDLWTFNEERVVRAVASCKKPIVSAIGHETDFTLCDFAADMRAPTPSAAAECVIPLREEIVKRLGMLKESLQIAAKNTLQYSENMLSTAKVSLASQHPLYQIDVKSVQLQALAARMKQAILRQIEGAEVSLEFKKCELTLLSPYHVLDRGYAIVTQNGRLITSVANTALNADLQVLLRDGSMKVKLLEVKQTESPE